MPVSKTAPVRFDSLSQHVLLGYLKVKHHSNCLECAPNYRQALSAREKEINL